jgi:hypothetical protein
LYGGKGASFGVPMLVYSGAEQRVPYSLRVAEPTLDDALSIRARSGLLGSLTPGRNVVWLDIAVHKLGASQRQIDLVVGSDVRHITLRCSDDTITRHYLSLLYGGGQLLLLLLLSRWLPCRLLTF